MSQVDEVVTEVTTRKISFSFERNVSDGNYGGTKCSAWASGEVAADATVGEIAQSLGDLATAAVAAVLDQLGIPYEPDADAILREKFVPKAAPVTTATAVAQRALGTDDASLDGEGVRIMNPKDSTEPIPLAIRTRLAVDGVTAVFDNRNTKSGKQPDFKEAVARGGSGHGKDGSAKGYWLS